MRMVCAALLVTACSSSRAPGPHLVEPAPSPPPSAKPSAAPIASAPKRLVEKLAADVAPADWSTPCRASPRCSRRPRAIRGSRSSTSTRRIADAALAEAWAAYKPTAKWPLKATTASADKDGWQDQRNYTYRTSPDERRSVSATTMRHEDSWTVAIYDVSHPTGDKRIGAVSLIFGRLLPTGYTRESFAGKRANPLDAARIGELGAFVERAQKALGVPGVSIGLIQAKLVDDRWTRTIAFVRQARGLVPARIAPA